MKTTMVLEDELMRRLKALAAERGQTLSSLVEEYLRRGLLDDMQRQAAPAPAALPVFEMGAPQVDIADRAALDDVMERADRVRR